MAVPARPAPRVPPAKAILIPGNGCDGGRHALDGCMWYPWLAGRLRARGVACELSGFPDPLYAREAIWKEFCVGQLGLDASTLVIGHSSGAACALRLMEEHAVAGCVLVSAYNNDLGDRLERGSGYFSRPFDYAAMRRNAQAIVQFHSRSDHLVPVAVGRDVAAQLRPDCYVETASDGHFQEDEYEAVMWPAIERAIFGVGGAGGEASAEAEVTAEGSDAQDG